MRLGQYPVRRLGKELGQRDCRADVRQGMVLSASPPSGAKNAVATSYGWGSIPIMTVYRADMDGEDGQLPVLTWNRTI